QRIGSDDRQDHAPQREGGRSEQRVEGPAGEGCVGRLEDGLEVLERGLVGPPLDGPCHRRCFALQRSRDHPVDRRQEQECQQAQQQEARYVTGTHQGAALRDGSGCWRWRHCRSRPGVDGSLHHDRPRPRSRTVSRNWNPVTISSRTPKVSDMAAAELNWNLVNASSVMYIITLWVDLSGPPAVITCDCPKSWNEPMVVVTAANSVTGLSWGQVTNLNFAQVPAPSISAAS